MATAQRRSQPRFIAAGQTEYVSNSRGACMLQGVYVSAPGSSVAATIHDATASETLTAVNKRVDLFANASGSSELNSQFQFNTGCHVSVVGTAGGVTIGFIGKT